MDCRTIRVWAAANFFFHDASMSKRSFSRPSRIMSFDSQDVFYLLYNFLESRLTEPTQMTSLWRSSSISPHSFLLYSWQGRKYGLDLRFRRSLRQLKIKLYSCSDIFYIKSRVYLILISPSHLVLDSGFKIRGAVERIFNPDWICWLSSLIKIYVHMMITKRHFSYQVSFSTFCFSKMEFEQVLSPWLENWVSR